MSIQQNQIVQPTYNGQDIYYRTPVDAIITDGMSLDDYIRNTTGVVESGENSNGRYVKFADGTMICQGSKTFTSVACNIAYGGLYRSGASNQMDDFPVEFYDIPVVNFGVTNGSASGNNSNTGPIVVVFMKTNTDTTNIYVPTKTNPGRVSIAVGVSQTISTITISYTAIGRWKDYDVSVLPDSRQSTIINSASTNYYDDEKVVGIWRDGKPIYRKTITGVPVGSNTSTFIDIDALVDTYVNVYGFAKQTGQSGNYEILPNINTTDSNYNIGVRAFNNNASSDKNKIRITTGSMAGSDNLYITVEYTKTTDSPVTSQTKDLLTVVNGKDISDLDTIIKQRVDAVINDQLTLARFGKLLWSGSFSTGTLTIPHLNEYSVICVFAGSLVMIGNQSYGGMSFRAWRSASISHYGYRFTYNATNNTLTTDNDNRGASDGANTIAITKIYGVF